MVFAAHPSRLLPRPFQRFGGATLRIRYPLGPSFNLQASRHELASVISNPGAQSVRGDRLTSGKARERREVDRLVPAKRDRADRGNYRSRFSHALFVSGGEQASVGVRINAGLCP
jgi:hypothetical protein